MTFEYTLENNIFQLHQDLMAGNYRHGSYQQFRITDPKARLISKSSVRDRLLHHAIYRVLYPAFDKTFVFDSYSCRNNKGTHKAFSRLISLTRKISGNYTQPCFALKLDIRKFFDSVDHKVLMDLLRERVGDRKLLELLEDIIKSFSDCHPREGGFRLWRAPSSERNLDKNKTRKHFCLFSCLDPLVKPEDDKLPGKGMPLGNLTSQLFANVYLDPLDKFAKHQLKAKHYLRYADDFVFLSNNPDELVGYLVEANRFLKTALKLNIHPNKIYLRKLSWGIDYVGYVALPHYSIPRQKTVGRIFKKVNRLLRVGDIEELTKAMPSYLGYLQHANSYRLRSRLEELAGYVCDI